MKFWWVLRVRNRFRRPEKSVPATTPLLKRSYGLKGAGSLWPRLSLDVNQATDVVLYTIGQIRERVVGFRTAFACA